MKKERTREQKRDGDRRQGNWQSTVRFPGSHFSGKFFVSEDIFTVLVRFRDCYRIGRSCRTVCDFIAGLFLCVTLTPIVFFLSDFRG